MGELHSKNKEHGYQIMLSDKLVLPTHGTGERGSKPRWGSADQVCLPEHDPIVPRAADSLSRRPACHHHERAGPPSGISPGKCCVPLLLAHCLQPSSTVGSGLDPPCPNTHLDQERRLTELYQSHGKAESEKLERFKQRAGEGGLL